MNYSDSLLKKQSTYLKLILFTGLTGAYHFYLNENKKAIRMIFIFMISLLLLWIFPFGLIGFTISSILWIIDLFNFKKSVVKYNENIENLLTSENGYETLYNLKSKNKKEYTKSLLTLGLFGLEDLYLERTNLLSIRFIINNLCLLCYCFFFIYVSIAILPNLSLSNDVAHYKIWIIVLLYIIGFLVYYLKSVGFLVYCLKSVLLILLIIIILTTIYTIFKIFYKLLNINKIVLEYNTSIKNTINNYFISN